MKEVRGMRRTTPHVNTVRCFLVYLDAVEVPVNSFGKAELDAFIVEQATFYKKRTLCGVAGCLRAFCRYLVVAGIQEADLSALVTRPRMFRCERDPRHLKSHEVERVVNSQDVGTTTGIRNKAILALLAVYGLRSSEIIDLRLDDVQWRRRVLYVHRRKCDDALELPLTAQVGKALLEYLRVRPRRAWRQIFLSARSPHRPIRRSAIYEIAKGALARADVHVPHPGAHTFRYSHAQALFEAGSSLHEIASSLGHSDIRTTVGYLQISVHPLREVALNDGEDMA